MGMPGSFGGMSPGATPGNAQGGGLTQTDPATGNPYGQTQQMPGQPQDIQNMGGGWGRGPDGRVYEERVGGGGWNLSPINNGIGLMLGNQPYGPDWFLNQQKAQTAQTSPQGVPPAPTPGFAQGDTFGGMDTGNPYMNPGQMPAPPILDMSQQPPQQQSLFQPAPFNSGSILRPPVMTPDNVISNGDWQNRNPQPTTPPGLAQQIASPAPGAQQLINQLAPPQAQPPGGIPATLTNGMDAL